VSAPFQLGKLVVPVGPDDHVQGPANAPVTLVEYGDYECPFCGEAFVVVQEVQALFGDTLRFVFRNFPLTSVHPHAREAAFAAEAAGMQGAFWPMHDRLYENQDALDVPDLVAHAEALGLDMEAFERDFGSSAVQERVRRDFLGGVRSGVNGTPTFFVNGVRHEGSYRLDELARAIESQMRAWPTRQPVA
jgi:protein-disulfide isomerase